MDNEVKLSKSVKSDYRPLLERDYPQPLLKQPCGGLADVSSSIISHQDHVKNASFTISDKQDIKETSLSPISSKQPRGGLADVSDSIASNHNLDFWLINFQNRLAENTNRKISLKNQELEVKQQEDKKILQERIEAQNKQKSEQKSYSNWTGMNDVFNCFSSIASIFASSAFCTNPFIATAMQISGAVQLAATVGTNTGLFQKIAGYFTSEDNKESVAKTAGNVISAASTGISLLSTVSMFFSGAYNIAAKAAANTLRTIGSAGLTVIKSISSFNYFKTESKLDIAKSNLTKIDAKQKITKIEIDDMIGNVEEITRQDNKNYSTISRIIQKIMDTIKHLTRGK